VTIQQDVTCAGSFAFFISWCTQDAAAAVSCCCGFFTRLGFFFGRISLIKLSPKKTWEGFIGGFIGTAISAAILANIMSQFKWMTCPRQVSSLRHQISVYGRIERVALASLLLCEPNAAR